MFFNICKKLKQFKNCLLILIIYYDKKYKAPGDSKATDRKHFCFKRGLFLLD